MTRPDTTRAGNVTELHFGAVLDRFSADVGLPGPASESRLRELAAHQRAMPRQRLVGNGMEYADAIALHALAESGVAWPEAAAWLASVDLIQAGAAQDRGELITARSYFHAASACLRFGQLALGPDDDRKPAMYGQMVDAFAQALALADPPGERIEVPYRNGRLCGWLLLPSSTPVAGTVIVVGGIDGWCQEYYADAGYLLERGLAVVLAEAPGQGETRLFHDVYMTVDVEDAFRVLLDHLWADPRLDGAVGIWGNSFGGYLAARVAARDRRFAACCVNGGSARPGELLERYPRMAAKVAALFGSDEAAGVEAFASLDLAPLLPSLTAALLQLHSVPDQVFRLEVARLIHDGAAAADKTLAIWDDGDHCIYNHSHDKRTLVADWFASRLRAN